MERRIGRFEMTDTQPKKDAAAKASGKAKPSKSELDVMSAEVAMQSLAHSTDTYVEWMTGWNREIANFLERRLARQREFTHKACACKDASELVEFHREWAETAHQDYAEELKKLTDLGLSFAEKHAGSLPKTSGKD